MEAVAVVFGLIAGYWVVSKLFFQSRPVVTPVTSQPSRAAWHEVLNVDPTASAEEIHAAYRRLISQYHPDKVEHLGPELKELAARKSQEITVAYQTAVALKERQA
jgi:DnaJ like chaperone protein